MFEWTIPKNQLVDLIKKMSLPIGKGKYVFETIAPMFTPNEFMAPSGDLEWVSKTGGLVVCVRAQGLDTTGLTKPIRIPFNTKDLITWLKQFKNENLSFTYDVENNIVKISELKTLGAKSVILPLATLDDVHGMQETLDVKLENSKLHVVCDVDVFRTFIDKNKRFRDKTQPETYRIIFDGENQKLGSIIGDEKDHTKRHFHEIYRVNKIKGLFEIEGDGEVYYANGLTEVMGALKGKIEIRVLDDGSMWVTQGKLSDIAQANYLIQPATHNVPIQ